MIVFPTLDPPLPSPSIADRPPAPPAHPLRSAGPVPQPLQIGVAAELPPSKRPLRTGPVPSPRSNRSHSEAAALLALVQGPAAGLTAGRERLRLRLRLRLPGRGGADAGGRCTARHHAG